MQPRGNQDPCCNGAPAHHCKQRAPSNRASNNKELSNHRQPNTIYYLAESIPQGSFSYAQIPAVNLRAYGSQPSYPYLGTTKWPHVGQAHLVRSLSAGTIPIWQVSYLVNTVTSKGHQIHSQSNPPTLLSYSPPPIYVETMIQRRKYPPPNVPTKCGCYKQLFQITLPRDKTTDEWIPTIDTFDHLCSLQFILSRQGLSIWTSAAFWRHSRA